MPKPYNSFIKYTGLGIQMAVVIIAGYYLGVYLDEKHNPGSELWSKILTLVAVFLSTVMVIRQVTNDSK